MTCPVCGRHRCTCTVLARMAWALLLRHHPTWRLRHGPPDEALA